MDFDALALGRTLDLGGGAGASVRYGRVVSYAGGRATVEVEGGTVEAPCATSMPANPEGMRCLLLVEGASWTVASVFGESSEVALREEIGEAAGKAEDAAQRADEAAGKADDAAQRADSATAESQAAKEQAAQAAQEAKAAQDAAASAWQNAEEAERDAEAASAAAVAASAAAQAAQEKAEEVQADLAPIREDLAGALDRVEQNTQAAAAAKDAADAAAKEADEAGAAALAAAAEAAAARDEAAEAAAKAASEAAAVRKEVAEAGYATASDLERVSGSISAEIDEEAQAIRAEVAAGYVSTETGASFATKSEVEQAASAIRSEVAAEYVSADALESKGYATSSEVEQTAESIRSEVAAEYVTNDGLDAKGYATASEVEQTADAIRSEVESGYVSAATGETFATKALLEQTAAGIRSDVAEGYVSAGDAAATYATKSSVEQTASAIRSEVSATYATKESTSGLATKSEVEQTAGAIRSEVASGYVSAEVGATLATKSEVEQTAAGILSTVDEAYVTNDGLAAKGYATSSEVSQTAAGIRAEVAQTYTTKADASTLATKAEVEQTASAIRSEVSETYLTADDAADEYATRSSVEQTAAAIRSEVSTGYATKGELTAASESLSTRIEQTAEGVEQVASSVTSLESDVTEAQSSASAAQEAAASAQQAADAAKAEADSAAGNAAQAQSDLAEAKRNLASVEGRVGAAEKDVAAAQQAVASAQQAADAASAAAGAARSAAAEAQADADAAKATAEAAQADVDELAPRVTSAETAIRQNAEAIELRATKTEVSSTYATQSALATTNSNVTAAQNAANSAATAAGNAQSAAEAAQSTANTAKNNAATAQTAANNAASAAATAQSTADTAKANASAAQTAASNAASAASAAQSTANTANSTANAAKDNAATAQSEAERAAQAARNAKTAADAAQADIDGLSIGGRNLVKNSNFANGLADWVTVDLGASVQEDATFGQCIGFYGNQPGSSGCRLYADVYSNFTHATSTTYTLSFWAKAKTAGVVLQSNVAGGVLSENHTLTTDWVRYTRTYNTYTNGSGSLTFWVSTMHNNVYLTNIKLEKGNRATDWTPAPEDIESEVADLALDLASNYYTASQTDAAVKVGADAVRTEVSKVNSKVLATRLDLAEAWEQGMLTTTNGTGVSYDAIKATSSARIRTAGPAPVGGPVYVEWNDADYDVYVFLLDEGYIVRSWSGSFQTSSPVSYDDQCAYVGISVRRKDSAAITPSEATAAAVRVGAVSEVYASKASLDVESDRITGIVNETIPGLSSRVSTVEQDAAGFSVRLDALDLTAVDTMSATGALVHAESTAPGAPLISATVYGASEQDGTPSPTSPVPIDSVSSAALATAGRNLAESVRATSSAAQWVGTLYIEADLRPLTTYTLSLVGASGHRVYVNENLFNYKEIVFDGSTRKSVTVTTVASIGKGNAGQYANGYGWLVLKNNAGNTAAPAFSNVQLELGSAATAYEPYGGASHTFDLKGHELRSLPDGTRDELVVNADGSYGIVQRVGHVVLDGSEKWSTSTAEAYGTTEFYIVVPNDLMGTPRSPQSNASAFVGRCNAFKVISANSTYTDVVGVSMQVSSATGDVNALYINHGAIKNVADFKTWLASNPVTVDYALAVETYVPLGTIDPAPSFPETVGNAWAVTDVPTDMSAEWYTEAGGRLAKAAEAAGKTATNYLGFTDAGLVVGDMTASTLGNNVLIDSDSVDIRNGSTVNARFAADRIDLGTNSNASAVTLCGTKGVIAYDGSSFGITVPGEGDSLFVSADEDIHVYSRRSDKETHAASLFLRDRYALLGAFGDSGTYESYVLVGENVDGGQTVQVRSDGKVGYLKDWPVESSAPTTDAPWAWVKLASGIAVCAISVTATPTWSGSQYGLKYSAYTYTYPFTFATIPVLSVTPRTVGVLGMSNGSSMERATYALAAIDPPSGVSVTACLMAVGRWK